MIALLGAVLAASLLGSLHCAGMCGGLVAFYAGTPGQGGRTAMLPHLAYNAGRLAAYAALGAIAGALGAVLDATGGTLLGVQRVAAVVAGTLMLLWGVVSLLSALGVRVPRLGAPAGLSRMVRRGVALVAGAPPVARAGAIGVLTGSLPCGWLYGFVLAAAGTGGALAGAALMAVFWAGTLPVMLAVGVGVRAIARPLARHVPAASAVIMIVIGLLALEGRIRLADLPGQASHIAGRGVTAPPGHDRHGSR
jgi:sulfite exporter TauE/SafE